MTMEYILTFLKRKGGSDLHITVGSTPAIRLHGELVLMNLEELNAELAQELIYSVLTADQKRKFEETSEFDGAITLEGIGRFRLSIFRQKGVMGAVFRAVPDKLMTFEQLGLPSIIYDITRLTQGLVLVTGPTGCGKSTTLASIINYINENRSAHIVTVEDPIEYMHSHKRCLVNQREVGHDTQSFNHALRHVLRQDPNIILIGELRDLETIEAALKIAETGHLVFSTLHTNDTIQSINRIIDVFPPYQQVQVRIQLSFVLQSVLCQRLLINLAGNGRCLATEFLMASPAVRNLIREAKVEQIQPMIQTGSRFGMQTMNQSLADLFKERLISYETALANSTSVEDLKKLIGDMKAPTAARA